MIENFDLYAVATAIGTLFLSSAFALIKYNKYKALFNELVDLFVSIRDAYKDDEISKDEVEFIIDEANNFLEELGIVR